jgi:hypothetical protein
MRSASSWTVECSSVGSMRRMRHVSAAVILWFAGASLRAQSTRYTVVGTVADVDGQAIAGAEVGLLERDSVTRAVRSDTAGRFFLSGLQKANVLLRIRHFGFTPRDVEVNIPASRRQQIIVTLDPMPAELAGVEINADDSDERLRAFHARKASNNFAHFVDADDIARRRPQFLSEILRTIPGVSLITARGGYTVKLRGCSPLVWVDGVRLPGAQLDDVARPADVAGVEVYTSFAGIPAQYFDRTATCGTILVWTKAK